MRRSRQRSRSNSNRPRSGSSTTNFHKGAPAFPTVLEEGLDLNTNLGEGYGHYRMESEADLLPYVTSANIACGAHAGDPVLIEEALIAAQRHGLSIGAHIGYPDLAGFGRREIHLAAGELRACILYQLGALSGLAKVAGLEVTQVRAHGFLYRQMFHDLRVATIVTKAIAEFDPWLSLIGPACTTLYSAAERAGLKVAGEAWVDRVYDPNGHLLPHNHTKAKIRSQHDVLAQAENLIHNGEVIASDGSVVRLEFQTLHLHSGLPNAIATAQAIRSMVPKISRLRSEPFNVGTQEETHLAYGG
jgi:5-oxoprolinase (ATP-hydrolysing) subunit A